MLSYITYIFYTYECFYVSGVRQVTAPADCDATWEIAAWPRCCCTHSEIPPGSTAKDSGSERTTRTRCCPGSGRLADVNEERQKNKTGKDITLHRQAFFVAFPTDTDGCSGYVALQLELRHPVKHFLSLALNTQSADQNQDLNIHQTDLHFFSLPQHTIQCLGWTSVLFPVLGYKDKADSGQFHATNRFTMRLICLSVGFGNNQLFGTYNSKDFTDLMFCISCMEFKTMMMMMMVMLHHQHHPSPNAKDNGCTCQSRPLTHLYQLAAFFPTQADVGNCAVVGCARLEPFF